ncbi:flippase [uncultured Bifidobacterium sp.]|uniref:flippase n=1 Tax=uncultured Bifidobacterium sp. TaxID=165187 RepID=UPI00259540E0|nr:flippase [uncultured Bifidobacterium sp.]
MLKQSSLVVNSFFNVCYQLLNVLFPLITTAYVSRILMPDGIGKVAVAQNWVQYFVLFAALGIPNYGIREIARSRNTVTDLSKTFSELWILNAFSTTASIILYIVSIFVTGRIYQNYPIYIVVGLSIVFNYMNIDWFYQGIEEYRYIAIRSFIIKFVSIILIFLFINKKNDFIYYALISSIAVGGNYLINWFHLSKTEIHLYIKSIHPFRHLRSIIIMFSTIVSIQFYTLLITTILGFFSSESEVGFYSNSMKIVRMIVTVIAAISGTLLPRLSVFHQNGEDEKCTKVVNQVLEILIFLFIPLCFGLFLLAKELILFFFGPLYISSVETLRIAALSIIPLGLSNLFGTQVLLTYKRERSLLYCTILGAVVCIVFCALFIPIWHANGAAFSSVISELVVCVSTYFAALHCLKISIRMEILIKSIIASICMIICVHFIQIMSLPNFIVLFFSILSGIFVYFIVSILLYNPILKTLISIVKKA